MNHLELLENFIDEIADGIFKRRRMHGSKETVEFEILLMAEIRHAVKYPHIAKEEPRYVMNKYGKILSKYKCGNTFLHVKFENDEEKFIECLKEGWNIIRNL